MERGAQAPAKHKGANKPSKGAQEGSGKKANSGSAKDVPGKPGKKGKEDGEKGGSSISAQVRRSCGMAC